LQASLQPPPPKVAFAPPRIALIIMAMKVAARRYLSEFRDNYLARNDLALKAASAAKRLLK